MGVSDRGRRKNMGKMLQRYTKRIAFINLPHILAECEEKRQAAPLVVVSALSPKGVVLDYSKAFENEALKSTAPKVIRGAFLKDIEPLAAGTRVVPADYGSLEDAHERIVRFLQEYSPSVEARKEGEYYLDLTGTRRIFGREIDTCGRILVQLKRELGFTAHAGIGSNLLIGRLASAVVPEGVVYDIFVHAEREFIAPLSVRLLEGYEPGPLSGTLSELAGGTVDDLVSNYSIRRMEDLLAFSKEDLLVMFGREGGCLYACSRGESRSHLLRGAGRAGGKPTLRKEIAISSERNDDRGVRRWFFTLVLDLCGELREGRVFPTRFGLDVVYQDEYRYTRNGRIVTPSFFEGAVYRELLPCLDRALKRRTCVKKLILSFSHFVSPSLQLSLFKDASRMSRLAGAFDLITERFGKGTIRYGA
jgi:DNA polymerase-4